ncbi:hypothetical protein ABH931_006824 [Streptacidiphilus sp. MAP12-33]|uniref:hypothetical protein n=1 Tax=Streptacidiphilus sp. MAP12-33 TaxID=3156266 RepID=UPI00351279EB
MVQWSAPSLVRSARRVLRADGEGWPETGPWDQWGRTHTAAAEGLLRLRDPARRRACAAALEELLDRVAFCYPPGALRLLGSHLPAAADVVTAGCVERVLRTVVRRWNQPRPGEEPASWNHCPPPEQELARLAEAVAAAGQVPSLWELLTRILGEADRAEYADFRLALRRSLPLRRLPEHGDPPIDLLAAAGPLDRAAWWCHFGDLAHYGQAPERAQRYWARANELGHPGIARRRAFLALRQADVLIRDVLTGADELDPDEIRALLRTAQELDPEPTPQNRFCLLVYARAAGLHRQLGLDLRELRRAPVGERAAGAFWLGLARHDHGERQDARRLFKRAAHRTGNAGGEVALVRALRASLRAGSAARPALVDWTDLARGQLASLVPAPEMPPSPLDGRW